MAIVAYPRAPRNSNHPDIQGCRHSFAGWHCLALTQRAPPNLPVMAEGASRLDRGRPRKHRAHAFNRSTRQLAGSAAAPAWGTRLRRKAHARLGLRGHVHWHSPCYYDVTGMLLARL
jgi:hypothetical protein